MQNSFKIGLVLAVAVVGSWKVSNMYVLAHAPQWAAVAIMSDHMKDDKIISVHYTAKECNEALGKHLALADGMLRAKDLYCVNP